MDPSQLHCFAFNLGYAQMLMNDIEDARMAEQPGGLTNHPAWTLGHLIYSLDGAVQLLGEKSVFVPDEDWNERFGMGSTPSADRGAYPAKQALLDALVAGHEQLTPAVQAADEKRLAAAMPDKHFRRIMPTIGNGVAFLMGIHYATHLGELAAWRRAAGYPRVI